MTMYFTDHFTYAELTTTDTGLDNTPDAAELVKLKTLAIFMEKVRAILGNLPITVDSAFRSEAVNEDVGGVPDSAHRLAYACDFTCSAFGTPLMIAERLDQAQKSGAIDFDQLIYEIKWVHISRDPQLREERLSHPSAGGYVTGIVDVT